MKRYMQKLKVMCEFGESLAVLSVDPRIKVGCVIFPVDCTEIYAIGYNGPAAGLPHSVVGNLGASEGSGCAHAEANALVKFSPRGAKPALMYCTHSPCSRCAPLLLNAGIVGLIYRDEYFVDNGLSLLVRGGLATMPQLDLHLTRVNPFIAEWAAKR